MTRMKKSTATMETREMKLKTLQLVIDEQSPIRIKPDSLIFLVKRKLQDHYVLLNRLQMLREWHTTRHTFHSEIGVRSVLQHRGRSSPHRRVVVNKTADTMPKFQTDYMFIRTVAESKTQPCITFVETRSGAVISFMFARKGGYEDLTKEILRHFEAYGFLNPVIIQCDKEMSIIDVCRKVARERNARTVSRFAPKTSHQSNGFVETVHGHIQGLARCHQTQIETNTGVQLSAISPFYTICNSSRWICSLKIHSAARRQNPIPIFAWNSICITFVHVW